MKVKSLFHIHLPVTPDLCSLIISSQSLFAVINQDLNEPMTSLAYHLAAVSFYKWLSLYLQYVHAAIQQPSTSFPPSLLFWTLQGGYRCYMDGECLNFWCVNHSMQSVFSLSFEVKRTCVEGSNRHVHLLSLSPMFLLKIIVSFTGGLHLFDLKASPKISCNSMVAVSIKGLQTILRASINQHIICWVKIQ